METLIAVVFVALFTWLGYSMAEKRGRSPILWAFMGFFFNIIAIAVLLIMGNTKVKA
jgi:hypothetical protein